MTTPAPPCHAGLVRLVRVHIMRSKAAAIGASVEVRCSCCGKSITAILGDCGPITDAAAKAASVDIFEVARATVHPWPPGMLH